MRATLWQKSISKWEKVSFANRILNIFHALEISFIVEIALIKLNNFRILDKTTLEIFALASTSILSPVGRLPIAIDPPLS
jgi:hypothetical protein